MVFEESFFINGYVIKYVEMKLGGAWKLEVNGVEFLYGTKEEAEEKRNKLIALFSPKPKTKRKIDYSITWSEKERAWVGITDDMIAMWHKMYPLVDLEVVLQGLEMWWYSEPKKRSKRSNIKMFLERNIMREQKKQEARFGSVR